MRLLYAIFHVIMAFTFMVVVQARADEIIRPEEVKSKRQVVYDQATYDRLSNLWQEYHNAYPSEYAYANWMYASRYAGHENYPQLLKKGLEKYPANPTLLYLTAMNVERTTGDDAKARRLYERAVELDPSYIDPWFSLVILNMASGEREKLELSLRKLLESGAVSDEIMDFNYNVLAGLDSNAILITNGDNDTYPAWILTQSVGFRSDITIVNRSLLNMAWYPTYVIKQGVPHFLGNRGSAALRESIIEAQTEGDMPRSPGGPLGDTLIKRIVASAERAGRPVYFAKTLAISEPLRDLYEEGFDAGLAVLVTEPTKPSGRYLRELYTRWVNDFRTGGLQSWHLREASPATAGQRWIAPNYAYGIAANLASLKEEAPDLIPALFRWYLEYVDPLLVDQVRLRAGQAWACYGSDVKEVVSWCRKKGFICPKQKAQ